MTPTQEKIVAQEKAEKKAAIVQKAKEEELEAEFEAVQEKKTAKLAKEAANTPMAKKLAGDEVNKSLAAAEVEEQEETAAEKAAAIKAQQIKQAAAWAEQRAAFTDEQHIANPPNNARWLS